MAYGRIYKITNLLNGMVYIGQTAFFNSLLKPHKYIERSVRDCRSSQYSDAELLQKLSKLKRSYSWLPTESYFGNKLRAIGFDVRAELQKLASEIAAKQHGNSVEAT